MSRITLEHHLPEPEDYTDGNGYCKRYSQKRYAESLRLLTAEEIRILSLNRNKADDWKNIEVSDPFNPLLVEDCSFFGKIRLGKIRNASLRFHDLKVACGIRNSTLTCCDVGDDPAIENVALSYYITGHTVILKNINEILTTNHAKFGNGIVKNGEDESVRIDIGIGNENGGRSILPHDQLTSADAYLWYKYRDRPKMLDAFQRWTENPERGWYGEIGNGVVIKSCRFIKDVKIGDYAYIKGANKLKNLTIHSSEEAPSQVGEGVELVNGIIGYGCRIFYGVKAVRFILKDHSQLKYGARLINSFLSENSTISCCEVLNSFIYPCHEQHHNNSFLIGSVVMGQSNIAAAATIGSNHNSRGADGEIVARRGFWPGLSVSLKHNSRFASFCLIAKGSYPAEIDLPLPFCLLSTTEEGLTILPGYWFEYNMYALARNSWKFGARDKRTNKPIDLEFDYLAPDTAEEIIQALELLETWTAEEHDLHPSEARDLLRKTSALELHPRTIERGNRSCRIRSAGRAWQWYKKMLGLYAIKTLLPGSPEPETLYQRTFTAEAERWTNVGGQLIAEADLSALIHRIEEGKIDNWKALHQAYAELAARYPRKKIESAEFVLRYLTENQEGQLSAFSDWNHQWRSLLEEAGQTRHHLKDSAFKAREKDFTDPFCTMMYNTPAEQAAVIGQFEDDRFLQQETREAEAFSAKINRYLKAIEPSC